MILGEAVLLPRVNPSFMGLRKKEVMHHLVFSWSSAAMMCFLLVLSLFPGVFVQSLEQVSGYQGDNVTLHLGAEPSWTLEHIEWYIFTNNTWIATYRNKIPNTGWRPQYRGRLSLDTHTGDLTIHNLRSEDALEYTAYVLNTQSEDVVRKIKVTVKQPPLTPSIQTVTNMSVSGRCLLVMLCSSLDEDVELSWDSEPPAQGFYRGNHGGPGVSVFLLMFINSTYDSARVNCSSSTTTDNIRKSSSQVIRPTCAGEQQPPIITPTFRDRSLLFFFLGVLVVGVIVVLILLCYRGRWTHKLCSKSRRETPTL